MLYGLPPNLCCFVVPGLGKTPKAELQNSTRASAQNEAKVGQESKAGGSILKESTQLSSAEPRRYAQPWSAICPKLLLEYVIIPIAAQICPKVLKKHINNTARSAIEMIDRLESGKPKTSSVDLKAAYLHNLIEDLNLYTSDPLVKDTTESFIKEILNQKFGGMSNETFEENKSKERIQSIGEFRNKVSELKNGVEYKESKEKGGFFDSVFESLKELNIEAETTIRCNDVLNQAEESRQKRKEYQNQATFAQILKGEVEYSDDD